MVGPGVRSRSLNMRCTRFSDCKGPPSAAGKGLALVIPRAPADPQFGDRLMLIQLVSRSKKAQRVNHLTECVVR
jgi:hypothetical protein